MSTITTFLTKYAVNEIIYCSKRIGRESVRISCGENGIIPLKSREDIVSYFLKQDINGSGVAGSDDIVVWLKGK
jgi:hypothetical protein